MTYGFNLEWEDLPDEFRDEKIDEYLAYLHKEEKHEECKDECYCETSEGRKDVNDDIAAHFPIYF